MSIVITVFILTIVFYFGLSSFPVHGKFRDKLQPLSGSPDDPSLVFVLIGNPDHQYWLKESIIQARIFNPRFPFYLIATEEIFSMPSLESFLTNNSVKIVNYSSLVDDTLLQEFRRKFIVIGMMSPSYWRC